MGHKVALSSSDGRFEVMVSSDDAELIASMLILLEVPRPNTGPGIANVYALPQQSHAA